MKVLVYKSREFNNYEILENILDRYEGRYAITEIIEAEARGDTLPRLYGEHRGIPVRSFSADWNLYGKRAGYIRNAALLAEEKPEWVIALRRPESRATENMIKQARKAGVPVNVYDI